MGDLATLYLRAVQRLHGMSVFSSHGPIREGFVEFGDSTVLVGPNDSGKTRLLNHLGSVLADPLPDFTWDGHQQIELFTVVSAGDVAAFLDPNEPDYEEAFDEIEMIEPFREELELLADDGNVLLGIDVAALAPARLPAWRYGRSLAQLPDELRSRVRAALPPGYRDPEVPRKLEYLGGVDPSILPKPIVVPSSQQDVEREAGDAIARLCASMRTVNGAWAILDEALGALEAGPDPSWQPPDDERGQEQALARQLLEERPDASEHHPAAIFACEAFERIASELLPDFITRKYNLSVCLDRPSQILCGQFLDIRLVPGEPDEGEAVEAFPLRDAATGFNVWLQLALREAAARLQMLDQVLTDGVNRAYEVVGWIARNSDGETDAAIPQDAQMNGVKDAVERVFLSLEDSASAPPESLAERVELRRQGQLDLLYPLGDTLEPGWRSPIQPRLYLLDEPEQHLHPSLQRRAARWLAELMRRWGSQCVLATHSVAFMDMPGDVTVYELVRKGDRAVAVRFDLAHFTPRAQLAHAMGFDRGELLSRWDAFLFVEGRGDIGVVEELFAERLRASRVCVLPVHGHRSHTGILDMAVLAIGTAAPIAVLFDGVTEKQIQDVRRFNARERAHVRREAGEIGTVVRIVDLEIERERSIEILTVGVPDVFDLLDEDSIRSVFARASDSRQFPGHQEARSEFERAGGGNAAAYKDFLLRSYGIQTSERSMRRIARDMKLKGRVCEPLDDVLLAVERLALQAQSTD